MRWLATTWFCLALCAAAVCGSGCVHGDESPDRCAPTGWVDRLEGDWAVVDPDAGGDEESYPVHCFPQRPEAGTRIELGYIDRAETERMRLRIQALVKRLTVDE